MNSKVKNFDKKDGKHKYEIFLVSLLLFEKIIFYFN